MATSALQYSIIIATGHLLLVLGKLDTDDQVILAPVHS